MTVIGDEAVVLLPYRFGIEFVGHSLNSEKGLCATTLINRRLDWLWTQNCIPKTRILWSIYSFIPVNSTTIAILTLYIVNLYVLQYCGYMYMYNGDGYYT